MSCCGNQNPICPCGAFIHPAVITNVAGLDAIAYRIGDYTTFREALLRALPGEVSLTATQVQSADGSPPSTVNGNVVQLWRPGATGDLAVQMIEWWAYLADILTFYNERTATQAYLRTADQSITVNRLVRLLGYRPKPGIGAAGTLAALVNGTAAFTLPSGFQIQSKPGPGQPPQIFEVATTTTIQSPDVVAIDPYKSTAPVSVDGGQSVLLSGVINSVKPNDHLLLLEQGWDGSDANYALVTVSGTAPEQDPLGHTNTRVKFVSAAPGSISSANASGFRLLKSTQSTPLWSYFDTTSELSTGKTNSTAELASLSRQIKVGDPVLVTGNYLQGAYTEYDLRKQTQSMAVLASVSGYSEAVWYTDASLSQPTTPPTATSIPILHSTLGLTVPSTKQFPYTTSGSGKFHVDNVTNIDPTSVLVAFAFQEVGTLIGTPSPTLSIDRPAPSANWMEDPSTGQLSASLTAEAPEMFPTGSEPREILLMDVIGNGVAGKISLATLPSPTSTLTITPPNSPPASLTTPLDVLFNLLPVTRGKTVANEVLGSGNAAIAGQDFVLQKSPVTYLQDPAGRSGYGYSSTVQVWVNYVEWTEVQNFYNQPPNAQVFITKEDEQGQTHVIFGDGLNGARLPTGANNIVATYRYGSGAAVPAASSLTVLLKPMPGLKAIRNPVPVGGGGDPDPPEQVRQYAPLSVLTFGRAVSLDDFEAIASTAPGVTRAQANFGLNPVSQRPQVQICVLPGVAGAVKSAQAALAGAADPNRVPSVQPATLIAIRISALLVLASNADPATVQTNATSSLAGQKSGLFVFDPNSGSPGVYILGIGQAVFNSQIYAALQVFGVQAVENLVFSFLNPGTGAWQSCARQRHDPQPGNYFALAWSDLAISTSPPITSS